MQWRRAVSGCALVAGLATAAMPTVAGTIAVTNSGAPAAGACTLAQAIYAANLASNPTNATPAGATTVAPLSDSTVTTVGIGTCTGAPAGANTIDLSAFAGQTLTYSAADNYWYSPNALPPIASAMTIEGHGTILNVTDGTTRLRFFFVGADATRSATPGYNTPGSGNLQLHNLTLTGGRQQGGMNSRNGGGGAGMAGRYSAKAA